MDGLKLTNSLCGEYCLFQTVKNERGGYHWKLAGYTSEISHETAEGATLEFVCLALEGCITITVKSGWRKHTKEEFERDRDKLEF